MNSSAKRTFAYSLIATFALFSFIMTLILSSYKATLSRTNQRLNDYAIETIHSSIQDSFTSIYSACGELFADIEEANIGFINNPSAYYSSKGVYNIIEKIKFYESLSNVSIVYIYLPDTDSVICSQGIYTIHSYYDMLFSKSALPFDEWKNNLLDTDSAYNYYSIDIFDHNSLSSQNAIVIDSHVVSSSGSRIIISAGVNVDILLKSVKETEAYNRCSVSVLDNGRKFDVLKSERPEKESHYAFSADSNLKTNSSVVSISIATPINFLTKNIHLINTVLIILFIFTILFALLSLIYIIRINYRSISSIFEQFGLNADTSNYKSLMKTIETTQVNHTVLSAKFNVQKYQTALLNILSGNIPSKDILDSCKIFLHDGSFFVAGIFIPDFSVSDTTEKQPTDDEIKSIISNVFEEKFSVANLEGYVTHSEKVSYCLINASLCTSNVQSKIYADVKQCVEYVSEHFKVTLCAAISNAADSTKNIPAAFESVQKTISHMIFHHIVGCVVSDKDISSAISDKYIFSADIEQRLREAIANENTFEIHCIISSVFSELNASENSDTDYTKGILVDIVSFILKQVSASPSMFQSAFSTLLSIESLSKEEEFFRKLIDTLFSGNDNVTQTIDTSSISAKIIQYITKNYKNSDLSNTMIGEQFGLSAGYVARIFKAEYGESILSFIHKYRVSRAKKLLCTTDMSINSVSELTGFQHIRSFNRIFKKYEGVTPSEYIQMLNTKDRGRDN